jgi:hypothetical protein
MRIHYKDQVIRYCDTLIEAGITCDDDLSKIDDEGGEWINNSWFEVYDHLNDEYTMEIYHTVRDAIETVAGWITEEETASV